MSLYTHNVRRTFRDMVVFAGLGGSGITLHWFRRTAATVIARGIGTGAAATFLGHTSTAITGGHNIAPDPTIGHTPAVHLERALRPSKPEVDYWQGRSARTRMPRSPPWPMRMPATPMWRVHES